MSSKIWPQPLLVVRDVEVSGKFYAEVLDAISDHEGPEYGQIISNGELILQLHVLEAEHHHEVLADPEIPLGNGVLIWFETDDLDAAVERVKRSGAKIERGPEINPNANQCEIWFRDPDNYLVVIAGESDWRPRSVSMATKT